MHKIAADINAFPVNMANFSAIMLQTRNSLPLARERLPSFG